jgi:hypothetical protein
MFVPRGNSGEHPWKGPEKSLRDTATLALFPNGEADAGSPAASTNACCAAEKAGAADSSRKQGRECAKGPEEPLRGLLSVWPCSLVVSLSESGAKPQCGMPPAGCASKDGCAGKRERKAECRKSFLLNGIGPDRQRPAQCAMCAKWTWEVDNAPGETAAGGRTRATHAARLRSGEPEHMMIEAQHPDWHRHRRVPWTYCSITVLGSSTYS